MNFSYSFTVVSKTVLNKLNRKKPNKNNRIVRWINTKEVILNKTVTTMDNFGED